MFRYDVIRATGTKLICPAGGGSVLWTVNINTGVASAVLKVYDGTTASGTLVATIDASTKSSHAFGTMFPSGMFVDLSGGNADCTIGYA